jgi:hypothetical protein
MDFSFFLVTILTESVWKTGLLFLAGIEFLPSDHKVCSRSGDHQTHNVHGNWDSDLGSKSAGASKWELKLRLLLKTSTRWNCVSRHIYMSPESREYHLKGLRHKKNYKFCSYVTENTPRPYRTPVGT